MFLRYRQPEWKDRQLGFVCTFYSTFHLKKPQLMLRFTISMEQINEKQMMHGFGFSSHLRNVPVCACSLTNIKKSIRILIVKLEPCCLTVVCKIRQIILFFD